MEVILGLSHLSVVYRERYALLDISVNLPKGSMIGLVGPNGAGKSTLLKAIAGLITPSQGSFHFDGKPPSMAYVPQRSSIDWDFPMSAFELVEMGLWKKGLSRKERGQKVKELLKTLGMEAYSKRAIGELSGGQQQRLFIARALAQDPDLFLLDEVFNGIDIVTERFLLELFRSLADSGKTVVVVHHDLERVKESFDFAILLNVRLVTAGKSRLVLNEAALRVAYGPAAALFDELATALEKRERGEGA